MTDKLQVTVVYTIEVENLADYEAISTQGAADNLAKWFAEGISFVSEDLTYITPDSITVKPAGRYTTDDLVNGWGRKEAQ